MLSWCAVKFGLAVFVWFFDGFRHGESTEVDVKDGFVVSPTLVTAAVFLRGRTSHSGFGRRFGFGRWFFCRRHRQRMDRTD